MSCSAARPRVSEELVTQREMDLAASVQAVTEEVMLRLTRSIRKETDQKNLCLAGGVAFNCVANGKVLRDGAFDNIWIQPASGDAGGSLGAALCAYHGFKQQPRKLNGVMDGMKGAYLGPAFGKDAIETGLAEAGAVFKTLYRSGHDRRPRPKRWPMARRSAGSRAGWSSGRARSAAARSSAMRARRPCSAL